MSKRGSNGKSNYPARIVVVGASAGGLNALTELMAQAQNDLNVTIFIVLHLSRTSLGDFLIHRLQPFTSFQCKLATDGAPIQAKTIYIASPDQHLLVKKDRVLIGHGPAENRWRPSIDVLFRSAAVAYGPMTIGIILTGLLDDGTAGMWAIQRSGGICIVQDPNEAEFPDMPLSVLNNMEVDFCIPLAEMGTVLTELSHAPIDKKISAPPDVIAESEIAEKVAVDLGKVSELGSNSIFACPDCGGGLWHFKNNHLDRYRCHIGHSYSEKDLLIKQSQSIESTLWISVRMMEERRVMLLKMAENFKKRGLRQLAGEQEKKAEDIELHIQRLKVILFEAKKD